MVKKSKDSKEETGKRTKVISFRIAEDLYSALEQKALKERDETGLPLNASGMARRIVVAQISGSAKKF